MLIKTPLCGNFLTSSGPKPAIWVKVFQILSAYFPSYLSKEKVTQAQLLTQFMHTHNRLRPTKLFIKHLHKVHKIPKG